MNQSKLLSALSYFSMFFAPLLLPVIIYFAAEEYDVKCHAKRALLSHIIPAALLIATFVIYSFSIFSFHTRPVTGEPNLFWGFMPLLFTALYTLLFLIVLVWNVYQGIRVLK